MADVAKAYVVKALANAKKVVLAAVSQDNAIVSQDNAIVVEKKTIAKKYKAQKPALFFILIHSSKVQVPADCAFKRYLGPEAFERLTPPWQKINILSQGEGPAVVGSEKVFKVKIGPFWRTWVAKHEEFIPGQSFTDVQIKGPFAYYKHFHRVIPIDENSCQIEDEIHFIPPFSFLTSWTEKKLRKLLVFRHKILIADLLLEQKYPSSPLRILVSGSSGLVGKSLVPFLRSFGHHVFRLVRDKSKLADDAVYWNPDIGEVNKSTFEGFDAVIHLAGKNIASSKWTKQQKEDIALSRGKDTWLLSQILLRLFRPPKVLITASAVGIYGDRGEEILTEDSPPGSGFLAKVCVKWEEATTAIENRGTRCVHTRFGVILSLAGGFLQRIVPLSKMGLAAVLGSGGQYVSWVALEDVLQIFYHLLMKEQIEHAVNVVSPYPETQQSFTRLLCKALHRPLFLKIPKKLVKLLFGQMGEELFLASTRAIPVKLEKSGYQFLYPKLKEFFKQLF